MEFYRETLLTLAKILWLLLQPLCQALRLMNYICFKVSSNVSTKSGPGIGAGKNVLVTTGRQAKTLHTVRALKEIGARVLVADYDIISTSAISVSSDEFILLPSLNTPADQWISNFKHILIAYEIDVVLPVSTINEVLMIGLAKSVLAKELPHITWLCPNLEESLQLDDRHHFSHLCRQYQVPSPESGVLTSVEDIDTLAGNFTHGIILKRIESSVNRAEEIVPYKKGDMIPPYVTPSNNDRWQWQQFVKGVEKSAWYIVIGGKVTFSACYFSEADLTKFDPAPIPKVLDKAVKRLLKGMNLTGQFAFDFIEDQVHGKPYVIECNPRSSSILETVSSTPGWGRAFFGTEISENVVHRRVGFIFHGNCWPWSDRVDGHLKWSDPLPFLVAQIVWPLYAIASKGMTKLSYEKIDVNICKIIVNGPSPSRNIQFFQNALQQLQQQ